MILYFYLSVRFDQTQGFFFMLHKIILPRTIKCKYCDVVLSSKKNYESHYISTHKKFSPSIKNILILGGGFGAITVLEKIQKDLRGEKINITIVSEKNYFLFTPMLPQVASGLLHPSSISIPIRNFCKNAKFYQATIEAIDLEQKLVTIHRSFDGKVHALDYDYLVISIGSKTNFFSNPAFENHSFPIKTIEDSLAIRNHVLKMLEHADQTGNLDLQKLFLTFVVVGSGFAGVETIGEINHFVRKSVKFFYPNIHEDSINMILLSSRDRILPEVNHNTSKWVENYLRNEGIKVLKNSRALDATEDSIEIMDNPKISCSTIIWAAGVMIDPIIRDLNCAHDTIGRIIVKDTLQMKDYDDVFVIGDCACIFDKKTNSNYPSTAQHAIHEGRLVSYNLKKVLFNKSDLKKFTFHSMGNMAIIGDKTAIAEILGHSIKGFLPWIMWRTYYLLKMPDSGKKVKIGFEWLLDFIFSRDLTMIGMIKKKNFQKVHILDTETTSKDRLFSDLNVSFTD